MSKGATVSANAGTSSGNDVQTSGYQATWHACDQRDILINDILGRATQRTLGGDLATLLSSCANAAGDLCNNDFNEGTIRHDLNNDAQNQNWCGGLDIKALRGPPGA